MAELKCKCGAGPFESTSALRVHILKGARAGEKGVHGWATTKEFPNPQEAPVSLTAGVTVPPSNSPLAPVDTFAELFTPPDPSLSDLALEELDELRGFFQVLRSEFDALKEKVGATSAVWSEAVPPPTPIDQEAVNLAQLDAMMGIDQPSPLDVKEAEILAAVEARIETAEPEVEAEPAPTTTKKGFPIGYLLIVAFLAIVGVAVLIITQM
jgi:hypothetical protein